MTNKKNKIKEYVESLVRIQTMEIITDEIDNYNFRKILAQCRKYYLKYDSLKFERVVQYYYYNIKHRNLNKLQRIKKSKKVLALQQKYQLIDVIKLTTYLVFTNKISIQQPSDFIILEDIIKINLSIPIFDRTNNLNAENINIDKYLNMLTNSKKVKEVIKTNKEK